VEADGLVDAVLGGRLRRSSGSRLRRRLSLRRSRRFAVAETMAAWADDAAIGERFSALAGELNERQRRLGRSSAQLASLAACTYGPAVKLCAVDVVVLPLRVTVPTATTRYGWPMYTVLPVLRARNGAVVVVADSVDPVTV
jgi:hypothetical protein